MVGIPRFDAQIGRISVPTMQNFQQEQNEQIYKAVAGVANTTAKIAEDLYSAQKIHEATVEGGKATKETDLSQLPTPLTRAQEAYNNAAVASFYSDFSVDAERKINVSAFKNKDNPSRFLVETDAYINGIAQNIPDHLRKQVLRPIQMVRESKYDTLLKHRIAKNQRDSLETFQFNMWKQRKNANFITNEKDLDNYLAQAETTAETLIGLGGSSEDAIKYLKESTTDGLNRYLSGYFFKEVLDPEDFQQFFKKVEVGTTGIKALDDLPPSERTVLAQKAFDDWNRAENRLAEKNFTMASNDEARTNIEILNTIAKANGAVPDKTNPAFEAAKARVSKPIADAIENIQDDNARQSVANYGQNALNLALNGIINQTDLDAMKDLQIIGDEDYLKAAYSLNSFSAKNRQTQEYKQAIQSITTANKDMVYGNNIIAENKKRAFLIEKLNAFVDKGELTGDEITAYVMQIQKEADSLFSNGSEYDKKFTQEGFRKLFGVEYDKINEIGKKFIYGKSINRHKFKQEVMKKYNATSPRADALLTYWDNIRKLEDANGR